MGGVITNDPKVVLYALPGKASPEFIPWAVLLSRADRLGPKYPVNSDPAYSPL